MKIVNSTYVTATEKKHLRAFFKKGYINAKINTKYYKVTSITPENDQYLYVIEISSPYMDDFGRKRYRTQKIQVQHYDSITATSILTDIDRDGVYGKYLEKVGNEWIVPTNKNKFMSCGEYTICDDLVEIGLMVKKREDGFVKFKSVINQSK